MGALSNGSRSTGPGRPTLEATYILGAGGFAREVLMVYEARGLGDHVGGFVEENSRRAGQLLQGKPILDATEFRKLPRDRLKVIGGIGSPLRSRWLLELEQEGYAFDQAIHPDVQVHRTVRLGPGCVLCSGVG